MRTTLTLEPDVVADLERLRREGDRSYKEIVNELLRLGLRAKREGGTEKAGKPFRTRTADLGKPMIPLDNIAEVLAIAEGEDYR
jgi:hypothetical protein